MCDGRVKWFIIMPDTRFVRFDEAVDDAISCELVGNKRSWKPLVDQIGVL